MTKATQELVRLLKVKGAANNDAYFPQFEWAYVRAAIAAVEAEQQAGWADGPCNGCGGLGGHAEGCQGHKQPQAVFTGEELRNISYADSEHLEILKQIKVHPAWERVANYINSRISDRWAEGYRAGLEAAALVAGDMEEGTDIEDAIDALPIPDPHPIFKDEPPKGES